MMPPRGEAEDIRITSDIYILSLLIQVVTIFSEGTPGRSDVDQYS